MEIHQKFFLDPPSLYNSFINSYILADLFQCLKGPGRCVEKKSSGLFCALLNNCGSYRKCAECTEDRHCKQFYNLDVRSADTVRIMD